MDAAARAAAAVLLVVLAGCIACSPDGAATGGATPGSTPPGGGIDEAPTLWSAGAAFDYQLGGASIPPDGATVVVRDSTEEPAGLGYDICYVNGFQTQPGVEWPEALLLHEASGELLVDPGWPDEHLFDTSTAEVRAEVADRLAPAIEGCAAAGYDAVELDNLDSYRRSQGALTLEDATAFATLLVQRAHGAGLAVGQKNTTELEARGHDEIGFDFAVTEECDRYEECSSFAAVYGAHVLDVEYTDDLRGTFQQVCERGDTPASTILRDRDLVVPAEDSYVYDRC